MFHGIVDFFSRLRVPSPSEIFGCFYKSRTVTSALTAFNSTLADLRHVADHNNAQAAVKAAEASLLDDQARLHADEATSAATIASKLNALLT